MGRTGATAALLFILALPVAAAETEAAELAGADESILGVTTLDEVVVTGTLDSLSGLQKAIIEAENRFYARWNELNDDDLLDVRCRTEAPTGRRLNARRCDARLVDEATRQEALALFRSTDSNIKTRATGDIREEAAAELKKRTLLMLQNDPALRLALLQRARLQQMYDATREQKFRGRRVVFD